MPDSKFEIRSKDGTNILCKASNLENTAIKGIVIVCHGFGEHSGRYQEFAERLAADDYACILFDQRGHGNLPKSKLGVISGYDGYLDDIDAIVAKMQDAFPNIPLVLFGHSMGGNIAANYLLRRNQAAFVCGALESPWFGLYNRSPLLHKFVKGLSGVFPDMPLPESKTKLALDTITDDVDMQKEIGSDPLYHNRMSSRMFSSVNHDGCAYALENAPRLSIPLQLSFAENERIVSNDAIKTFRGRCGHQIKDEDFVAYKTCHAIHNGLQRKAFYDGLILFLNKFTSAVPMAVGKTHAT